MKPSSESEVSRSQCGIKALDDALEGGFPSGSVILLAGEPGSGKTTLSLKFVRNCSVDRNERGMYVSFLESKESIIANAIHHSGHDIERVLKSGHLKILEFTPMKKGGLSSTLDEIVQEVASFGAKRLVIDSFSAIKQALAESIEVRIALNVLWSTLVRDMGCTTILIAENEDSTGLMDAFAADGVLVLKKDRIDGKGARTLEIRKMRGTRIGKAIHLFSLEGGFQVFESFPARLSYSGHRFTPRPNTQTHYSTGSEDFDSLLGGGWEKGSINLVDVGEGVRGLAIADSTMNFAANGASVLIIPPMGGGAEQVRRTTSRFLGEQTFGEHVRIAQLGTRGNRKLPRYLLGVKGESANADYESLVGSFRRERKPRITLIGLDTMEYWYGIRESLKLLTKIVSETKASDNATILVSYPELKITRDASNMSDLHLKVLKKHGCILLYGIKPQTGLFNVGLSEKHIPTLTAFV